MPPPIPVHSPHLRIWLVEHRVVGARVAGAHCALHHNHLLGLPHLNDRHACASQHLISACYAAALINALELFKAFPGIQRAQARAWRPLMLWAAMHLVAAQDMIPGKPGVANASPSSFVHEQAIMTLIHQPQPFPHPGISCRPRAPPHCSRFCPNTPPHPFTHSTHLQ